MKRTRMPPGKPIARKTPVRERNPKRRVSEFARCFHSKARVQFVQGLSCLICGQEPSDNAHLGNKGAGASRRADYDQIGALCRSCHTDVDEGRIDMTRTTRLLLAHHTEMLWQAETAPQIRKETP